MLDANPSGLKRTIHVVDGDHAQRASLAMRISEGGAHAEIYENLDELVCEKPANGAVLTELPESGVQSLNRQLAIAGIYLPVIVFAQQPQTAQVVRAAHDGAADFLDAGFSSDEFIAAYDYALRFLERNSGALLARQRAEEQVSSLSERERQVLAFLLEGHSNKSMGKELNLSPRTIEDYRLNALRKLGVASTSAAIRIGLEAGLKPSGAALDAEVRISELS
jgi:FixJ family two-component response regulator